MYVLTRSQTGSASSKLAAGSAVAERVVGQVAGLESSELQAVQSRVESAIAILRQIEEIETGPRTQTGQRIQQIEADFAQRISRAREFGIQTATFEEERQRLILEIQENAARSVTQGILAITDPAAAAQAELAESQRQRLDELLAANVERSEIERLFVLEREQLTDQLAAANVDVQRNAEALLLSLTDPFAEAQLAVSRQIDELRQQLDQGLIPESLFSQLERQLNLTTRVNEALRRASGGAANPVEEFASVLSDFIGEGSPLSAAGQRLFDLTERFVNLSDAVRLVGGDVTALEESYLDQAATIREQLIQEIDRDLEARRRGVDSINALIASFRTDATQPGGLRLGAAQEQFQAALAGQNIQDILNAASRLREIAQAQFGGGAGFFDIQRQIEADLAGVREREQAAIEEERADRIAAADREQQMILQGDRQIEVLQTLRVSFSRQADFLEAIVDLQEKQTSQNDALRGLLEQLLARQRG